MVNIGTKGVIGIKQEKIQTENVKWASWHDSPTTNIDQTKTYEAEVKLIKVK